MEWGNLFVIISRHVNYDNVNTFLRVSKRVRRAFFAHSATIIAHLVRGLGVRCLPRWTRLAVDMEDTGLTALNHYLVSKVQEKHADVLAQAPRPCFVGGGAVSQVAFGKAWESDVDVVVTESP